MSESEIVQRLKGHIQACIRKHGRITRTYKGYIIRYIMDFIPNFSKKDAVIFYRKKVLPVFVESEKYDVKYALYSNGILINAEKYGILAISKENISGFIKELKTVGEMI